MEEERNLEFTRYPSVGHYDDGRDDRMGAGNYRVSPTRKPLLVERTLGVVADEIARIGQNLDGAQPQERISRPQPVHRRSRTPRRMVTSDHRARSDYQPSKRALSTLQQDRYLRSQDQDKLTTRYHPHKKTDGRPPRKMDDRPVRAERAPSRRIRSHPGQRVTAARARTIVPENA